jgi:hypothetical protein
VTHNLAGVLANAALAAATTSTESAATAVAIVQPTALHCGYDELSLLLIQCAREQQFMRAAVDHSGGACYPQLALHQSVLRRYS